MKLTTAEACTVLLYNGHIRENIYVHRKRPYYGVYQTIMRRTHQVGHITPKQFQEIIEAGLIEENSSQTDKYGNVYKDYVIPLREEDYEKR